MNNNISLHVLMNTEEVCPQDQTLMASSESVQEQNDEICKMFEIFCNEEHFRKTLDLSHATVLECICSFINNHNNYKSLTGFRNLATYIQRLEVMSHVTFVPEVIGAEFMERFEYFLSTTCNLASYTIEHAIGMLKNVLRWAHDCGAKVSPSLGKYKVKTSVSRPKVALTQEEIYKLYYFDIDSCNFKKCYKETLKKVRDQFILSCFLGQRYSDCKRITEKNFVGSSKEKFTITQQKTSNEAVVEFFKIYNNTPLIVKEILERYNYTAPYPHDIGIFNKHLHKLCKLAGIDKEYIHEIKVNGKMVTKTFKKYELISSHCGRRTFVSAAVKNNLSSEVIKRATGHKSDSSFNKYVIWEA